MSIILLEDYKSYLDIKNPEGDEKLRYIINFVNDFIPRYCGTSFTPTVVTNSIVASNDGLEILLKYPLLSVEELRLGDTQIVDPTTYIVDTEVGSLVSKPGSAFSTNRLAYRVDYTYGHSEPPRDIVMAAIEYITYINKREFNKSRTLGNGESSDYGDKYRIPLHLQGILNAYRVI